MQSTETKIAVIESRLNAHAQFLASNQELTAKLVDKLDLHIQASQLRDVQLQQNLSQVTLAINTLSSSVDSINPMLESLCVTAADSKERLLKWDTTYKTIAKLCVVGSVFFGGCWAVFTFVVDHSPARANNPSDVVLEK